MAALQTISIKLLGISPRDERMIQIVLSRQPSKSYRFALVPADQNSDVALVNTDLAAAEVALDTARQSNPALVPIFMSIDGQSGNGVYRIAHRSLLFQLVLTLEDIAATQNGSTRHSAIEQPQKAPAAAAPAAAAPVVPPAPAAPPAPVAPPPPLNSPSQYPQLAASKAPSPNDNVSDRAFEVSVGTMGMFNMRPLSALVVDDSVTVRNQLQAALQKAGLTADLASGGDQALLMLSKQSYDLIFLDVVMPGDDGYLVCKSIRKLPANKQTQVIMLTSRSSPFDRARGALAGCDMYLIKPIDLKTFYGAVDRTIMKLCKNDRAVAASRGYQLSV
jgi:two-component system, cell cycle response regulator